MNTRPAGTTCGSRPRRCARGSRRSCTVRPRRARKAGATGRRPGVGRPTRTGTPEGAGQAARAAKAMKAMHAMKAMKARTLSVHAWRNSAAGAGSRGQVAAGSRKDPDSEEMSGSFECAWPRAHGHVCLIMYATSCVPDHVCNVMRAWSCVQRHVCMVMRATSCATWWRRRESNPRPKGLPQRVLQVYPTYAVAVSRASLRSAGSLRTSPTASHPRPAGGALDQPAIVWRPLRPPQAGSGKASQPFRLREPSACWQMYMSRFFDEATGPRPALCCFCPPVETSTPPMGCAAHAPRVLLVMPLPPQRLRTGCRCRRRRCR
jgi:hypothetical protein